MKAPLREPRVGVGVLIWRDGKLFFLKRHGSHGAGTWGVPGGHLEFGESFEHCAQRETLEEVGIQIKNIRPFAITNDFFEAEHKHYATIWLESDWASGEPVRKEPHKILALAWHSFADLPQPLFEPCWQNLRQLKPELFS